MTENWDVLAGDSVSPVFRKDPIGVKASTVTTVAADATLSEPRPPAITALAASAS